MAKKLYKFYWDYGRQGDVEGLFIAEENEVKYSIGKEVYFGEILGKHSYVSGTLEEVDFTDMDITEDLVLILEEKLGKTISGYNPLDYLEGDDL